MDVDDILKVIGALVVTVVVVVALAVMNGVVIVALWGWFAVPLGVPPVSIAHAIGLGFLVHALTGFKTQHPEKNEDGTKKTAGTLVVEHALGVLLTVGLGWLVHAL